VLENEIGFLLAYTLGRISPNNNIKAVMNPTSKKKFSQPGKVLKSNNLPKEANNNTIEILIKLLETSNVANNLLGLLLNKAIIFRFLILELDIFFKSVLEREKKATSDPEISAEHIKRIIINNILIKSGYKSIIKKEMTKLYKIN
jgi:hypothetical protein